MFVTTFKRQTHITKKKLIHNPSAVWNCWLKLLTNVTKNKTQIKLSTVARTPSFCTRSLLRDPSYRQPHYVTVPTVHPAVRPSRSGQSLQNGTKVVEISNLEEISSRGTHYWRSRRKVTCIISSIFGDKRRRDWQDRRTDIVHTHTHTHRICLRHAFVLC